jgi:uncharacterized membrane protein
MHVTTEQPGGLWSLAVAILITVALVFVLYRRVFQSRDDWRLWRLVGLRSAALLLVLWLLYRPLASYEKATRERSWLAVLVDTSASMSVRDDPHGASRLELAQQALLANYGPLAQLGDVQLFQFDIRARPLKRLTAVGDLKATGVGTDLVASLKTAIKSAAPRVPQGVIVFTDGADTEGNDVPAMLAHAGVPIHCVATGNVLGGGSANPDVRLSRVECPLQMTRNTQAAIIALVAARGLAGHVARVELIEGETVLATEEITLDDIPGDQTVRLLVTPETKGRHEYTVRIPRLSDEVADQNNRQSVSTMVVDSHLRVLYVEGGLRAEYGTLVGRYLARDPAVEYLALVQTRPGVFVQRTNISDWSGTGLPSGREQLARFDVFLLGDLHSRFLGAERLSIIEKLVSEGKGLVMIGGERSFAGGEYGPTPMGELLPVVVGDTPRQADEEFSLKLTAAGQAHPIFANIRQFAAAAEGESPALPTLLGCTVLEQPKPSAEVLAIHPERGNEYGPLTVLAVHRYGKGRVAAFAADTTFRWFQVMQAAGEESPYVRFWGQFMRWLSGHEEAESLEPGLTVSTDRGFYEPGQSIRFEAVVVGSDGRGCEDARVEAHIEPETAADSDDLRFEKRAGRAGAYGAEYLPERAGLYRVLVTARAGDEDKPAGDSRLVVQVGTPSREFDRLDVDEGLLHSLADKTGGQYAHVSRFDRLVAKLSVQQHERRVLAEHRLYYPPACWSLIVGLLTWEWLLRRKERMR